MVCSIPHAKAFGMCHVVCFLTMWYAFSKPHKKLFSVFKGQKLLKPWHKRKPNVSVACGHSTRWESSCATLELQSRVALLGTQLVGYGPTLYTIIWWSLNMSYICGYPETAVHIFGK